MALAKAQAGAVMTARVIRKDGTVEERQVAARLETKDGKPPTQEQIEEFRRNLARENAPD